MPIIFELNIILQSEGHKTEVDNNQLQRQQLPACYKTVKIAGFESVSPFRDDEWPIIVRIFGWHQRWPVSLQGVNLGCTSSQHDSCLATAQRYVSYKEHHFQLKKQTLFFPQMEGEKLYVWNLNPHLLWLFNTRLTASWMGRASDALKSANSPVLNCFENNWELDSLAPNIFSV